MKLNKISRVLRMTQIKANSKATFFSSALLAIAAGPAFSAENNSIKESGEGRTIEVKNKAGEVEVIEVRGMRGTMTRSLNEKKNNSAIVDAIAAADFGDLPGLSLSDVIENISGASAHRLKGSQNEVSIRGLGSYWGYSTFNGRTITNAGPGRAVNFKKFPSDLVDKVVIYKSQQANLVEGGTSGTIDVNSLRAVDYGKSETSVEFGGMYNSYYQDTSENPWGSKFVLSTVQNFETDNMGDIGFTFGVSHQDTSNPEENYGGSSQMGVCALRAADGSALSDNGKDCTDPKSDQAVSAGRDGRSPTPGIDNELSDFDPPSIFYVPNDAYWRTGSDEDQRTNVVATVQWVPNEQWNLNADIELSRLEYTEERMELGLDSLRDGMQDHIIAADHSLLYQTGEAKAQLSGESRNQVDDYNGFGFNAEFYATEDLTFSFDTAYSESYRYRVRHRTKFKTEDHYKYALDYQGRNVPELTWLDDDRNLPGSADFNADEAFDSSDMNSFVDAGSGGAYAEYRRSHDERNDDIFSVNLDVNYALDNSYFSSIDAGVRYSTEHLIDYQTNDVSITLTDATQRSGSTDTDDKYSDGEFKGDKWSTANPEAYQELTQGIINNCQNGHYNNNHFDEETGAGGAGSGFATYDSKCFQGQMLGQIPGNNGDTSWYDIGERADGRNGSDRDVTEEIIAIYAMANIDTEAFGVPLTGNLGVRVVQTDTHSTGWGDKVYITSNEDGTFDAETNTTGEIEVVKLESSYTEVLPSINLSFQVTDDFYIRTAAYQAMSRFQMNAMSSGVSYETCEDEDESNCDEETNTDYSKVVAGGTASGNHMKPYLSDNFDLSFEYYPSLHSAITLALYHKSFVGGYESVNENRDITVSLDGVDTIYPDVSHSTVQTSSDTSTIKGVEVTANKHFVELPGLWSGLGASVAYNYADSDFVTKEIASPGIVPDANLFGFSSNVASASVYWEGDDLSLRLLYKYRSKYFQPNNLPFPTRSHRYVQDSEYLDFAAKYKISSNVSVSLKAMNLLNEPQIMTRGNDTTVSDYSRSGAKFYVGVKASF
jgi:TonB-dependent receptor